MVEFMFSDEMLVRITGKTLWADRCEDVSYNSFPASVGPDFTSLHYLTAPNMVQCDRADKSPMVENNGDTCSYSPYEQHRCCQHNVAFGWPLSPRAPLDGDTGEWAGGRVLRSVPRSPPRSATGPRSASAKRPTIPSARRYGSSSRHPKPVAFPFTVRIPGWCEGARIRINNQNIDLPLKNGQWAVLDRTWNDGDKVELELPMAISIRVWEKNHNSVSVDRGPLTYSLKIGERWVQYGDPGKWLSWEAFPATPWKLRPDRGSGPPRAIVRSGAVG